ncbi:DUF418 domain-containing protein [Actinomyces sp. 2119]|uniref:DUF418 domain-containing protein n=1 Tax=Actinomyces sp. 2119 TaxID=2321393 RepID=UPI000E6B8F13|nr:DUF418 domain-containing protein [Actinomyces sp. 2119]RJF44120.1 DUF418 domain-containing protein [Actinomyces sp. 2119]
MRVTTSFTPGVRYPAPDVARGVMLLLIAVANVPIWAEAVFGQPDPSTQGLQGGQMSSADSVWVLVRALVVDHRSYPLFAMLFGFGLVTMVNRRVTSGTRTYLDSVTGGQPDLATPAQAVWAQEQARVDARRLVRRRGWWMILFGAVHGIFFFGDIIATYGLIAVIFADWLARKRWRGALVVGLVVTVLCSLIMLYSGWIMTGGLEQLGVDMDSAEAQAGTDVLASIPWFITNILVWAGSTVSAVFFSMAVPAAFIGARLADTDLLSHPERHRSRLAAVAAGGMGIGILGALHSGLVAAGWAQPFLLDEAATYVSGLAGAAGWLALLALYAGGPTPDGSLHGLRRMASAVGRRSMTAYLSQTILFLLVFVVVPAVLGTSLEVGAAAAGLIAVAVWLVTVVICMLLERAGRPGPFEVALRTAVARSERPRAAVPAPGQEEWPPRAVGA